MTRQQRMEATIKAAFPQASIEIVDDSARHHGHGGARPEGETHYTITVIADGFNGKSRVDRHRTLNALLADEFRTGLHALALIAKTPAEAGSA